MDSPYVGADKEPGILSKIVLQYTAQNNPLFMYPLSSLINRKIYPIRLGMTDRPTPLIGVQLNEYLGHWKFIPCNSSSFSWKDCSHPVTMEYSFETPQSVIGPGSYWHKCWTKWLGLQSWSHNLLWEIISLVYFTNWNVCLSGSYDTQICGAPIDLYPFYAFCRSVTSLHWLPWWDPYSSPCFTFEVLEAYYWYWMVLGKDYYQNFCL